MPIEMRRVVLSPSEFDHALRAFMAANEQMFKGARLLDTSFHRTDPLEVSVAVQTRVGQQNTLSLGGPHLAAVLIKYCIDRRIPLPRQSSKSVRKVSAGIALDMVFRDDASGPGDGNGR
ncbi:hypothetical protein [Roseospira visakhapatnamensis]|uniref:Uncharacterized protein n=1 Tax=Roseospira visakhapatnamensis TaxID=390880 RepID=A0A7W6RD90_9PROT|nr:hypothetical protein [Roseospira visakhapatnamensis]MBB4265921.1 hypothetical protein [Roseospira visakhapatnamensis]